MAIPFTASTWKKVGPDIPLPTLNGVYSGVVQGADGSAYDKATQTIQAIGREAHDFQTYFNAAAISFDGGMTWTDSYRGDLLPREQQEAVFSAWSLTTDAGVYHYQARRQTMHSNFAADGTLFPGGIRLYISGPGIPAFSLQQALYTWPHIIADPANTGGFNIITRFPSITPPVKLVGSGPAGEDAFWMLVTFRLDVGGNNNRQTIQANDLWRSLDGFIWEKVEDTSASVGLSHYSTIFESTTGRLIVSGGNGMRYTDSPIPLGATWLTPAGFPDLPGGSIFPMYGGTLLTTRNGSLISGGFIVLSCDDGSSFFHNLQGDLIPLNSSGYVLKLGPSECLCITNGFADPATETKAYYSDDGGETWQDGGVWLSTSIGERPIGAFVKSDGHPLVVTRFRVFISSDVARGTTTIRTQCPLANAGLAAARPLRLCGAPLTSVCKD